MNTSWSFYFRALEHLEKLIVLLNENLNVLRIDIKFTEEEERLKKMTDEEAAAKAAEAEENSENHANAEKSAVLYRVNGCILTMITRLTSEFIKILQDSDCHSTDYVDKFVS